jgi:hypothetical protein
MRGHFRFALTLTLTRALVCFQAGCGDGEDDVRAPPAAGAGSSGGGGGGGGGRDDAAAAAEASLSSRDGATGGVWHAGGLAQRVFADLGIPSRAWPVRARARARLCAQCTPSDGVRSFLS